MNDDRIAQLEEPRGPQLPAAFGRIPTLAWIFIVIAVGRLWIVIDAARLGPAPEPLAVAHVVTVAVGSIAVLLLPAALLIRHREAPRRAPILTLGIVLFALGEALQVLSAKLVPLFQSAADDPGPFPVEGAYLAMAVGISALEVMGLVGIGRGLARTRPMSSAGGTAWTTLVLLFAGVLIVSRIADASRFLGSPTMGYPLYVLASTAVGIGMILAWAYLTTVTLHGVRAGAEPGSGWRLGVLAGGFSLLAYQLFGVISYMAPSADLDGTLFLASGLFAIGPALLLLAFAEGLPSIGSPPAASDD
jgi:hypothetical protein